MIRPKGFSHPTLTNDAVDGLLKSLDRKPFSNASKEAIAFRALCCPSTWPGSRRWIESMIWADDKKTGNQIKPKLNRVQTEINSYLDQCAEKKKPARLAILKARRYGVSRLMLWRSVLRILDDQLCASTSSAIVANKNGVAASLRDEARHILRKLPFRLPIDRSNRIEIRIKPPWDTALRIESAEAGEPLRGETRGFRFVHCTETAFWNDPIRALTAINMAVPSEPGTVLAHESTANGMNWWHDFWWDANQGKNDYKSFFFPWWYDPEWDNCDALAPIEARELEAHLDEEEHDLLRQGLSLGQLAWRRRTIRNECLGLVEVFRQENPGSPAEAFRVSGSRLFSLNDLERQSKNCHEPEFRLRITPTVFAENQRRLLWSITDDRDGPLRVWRKPEATHSYVIGADPSEGVGQDQSVAQVLDYHTGEQVACFTADNVPPMEFGRILACLGWWYNQAYLMPERNAHGNAVIAALVESGYQFIGRMIISAWASRVTQQRQALGWHMNTDSKPRAYGQLREALYTGSITIRDQTFIRAASAMFIDSQGRYDAPRGVYQDPVDAMAIAAVAMKLASDGRVLPTQPQSQGQLTLDDLDRIAIERLDPNFPEPPTKAERQNQLAQLLDDPW